ncbi:MAG: hypothetical protein Q8P53_03145 [Candidatus Shapirobacteria bacterium]|nr:hypothetical protein [Candidatus Shapirobacteria bacterium]
MSIDTILKWNLDNILPVKYFSKLYDEIEVELKKIDGWILKLDPSMKENDFKKLVKFRENLTSQMSRLSYLPHLMEAVDQKNSVAKLYKSQTDNLFLEYSHKTRPISHWLKGKKIKGKEKLDDKNAKRLFGAIKDLEYSLNYNRLAAKYTLSQKEEIIIAQKDISGSNVLIDLRNLIETEFKYEIKKK